MKRVTIASLVAVAGLGLASNASAQAMMSESKPMAFGAKVGVNFANLNGSDAGSTSSRTGLVIGAYANIGVADIISIQPEVLYSMKGASQSLSVGGSTYTATVKLNYLDIPVLLKVNVPLSGGSSIRPSLFAGPSLGILLSSKTKVEGGGVSQESDTKSDTKSTDFGIVVGAGLGFGFAGHEAGIDARYQQGLTSLDKSTSSKADVKNTLFGINLSVGF